MKKYHTYSQINALVRKAQSRLECTLAEITQALGLSTHTFYEIVKGNRLPTPDFAPRLVRTGGLNNEEIGVLHEALKGIKTLPLKTEVAKPEPRGVLHCNYVASDNFKERLQRLEERVENIEQQLERDPSEDPDFGLYEIMLEDGEYKIFPAKEGSRTACEFVDTNIACAILGIKPDVLCAMSEDDSIRYYKLRREMGPNTIYPVVDILRILKGFKNEENNS